MELIITLTDEQAAEISDIQEYAEALANDRIARKAGRERSAKILALSATSDEELDRQIEPLVAAKLEEIAAEKESGSEGKVEG